MSVCHISLVVYFLASSKPDISFALKEQMEALLKTNASLKPVLFQKVRKHLFYGIGSLLCNLMYNLNLSFLPVFVSSVIQTCRVRVLRGFKKWLEQALMKLRNDLRFFGAQYKGPKYSNLTRRKKPVSI